MHSSLGEIGLGRRSLGFFGGDLALLGGVWLGSNVAILGVCVTGG